MNSAFTLLKTDSGSRARRGRLTTAHGLVETPDFMPVGTQATVKTLRVSDLKDCGAQMILANAYHLWLRPGPEAIRAAGGLHRFMGWDGGLLTDSGGFQVFSLSGFRKVTEEGVMFQSPLDGSKHQFTPESIMEFQQLLGSDVIVPLDECVKYPCEERDAEEALERTNRWLKRSVAVFDRGQSSGGLPAGRQGTVPSQLFFGIVQGATYPRLRARSAGQVRAVRPQGYAIGGLSVGEPRPLMLEVLEATTSQLPDDAAHYLMGVGEPLDLIDGVMLGVDLFDCVVPTRHGRNGVAYTWSGRLHLLNAVHTLDQKPLDENCSCFACRFHSRSYLRHLLKTQEILGLHLLTLHNLWFYADLMRRVREAIESGTLLSLRAALASTYSVTNTKEIPS